MYLSSSTINMVCFSSIPFCSPVFFFHFFHLYCRLRIQPEDKSGSALRPVLRTDLASMGLYDFPAYGKPQPHPVLLVGAPACKRDKISEGPPRLPRLNPPSVIPPGKVRPAVLIRHIQPDQSVFLRMLYRVIQQVY